jgi:hypothetical protein
MNWPLSSRGEFDALWPEPPKGGKIENMELSYIVMRAIYEAMPHFVETQLNWLPASNAIRSRLELAAEHMRLGLIPIIKSDGLDAETLEEIYQRTRRVSYYFFKAFSLIGTAVHEAAHSVTRRRLCPAGRNRLGFVMIDHALPECMLWGSSSTDPHLDPQVVIEAHAQKRIETPETKHAVTPKDILRTRDDLLELQNADEVMRWLAISFAGQFNEPKLTVTVDGPFPFRTEHHLGCEYSDGDAFEQTLLQCHFEELQAKGSIDDSLDWWTLGHAAFQEATLATQRPAIYALARALLERDDGLVLGEEVERIVDSALIENGFSDPALIAA